MTAGRTQRVDQELVTRGLARSRAVAHELVRSGRVVLEGVTVSKPAMPVRADQALCVSGEQDPWVGRAAYKLLAALDAFPDVDPQGLRCVDVGASTGGFTQVLLHRGASHVMAIDVGHGQLAAPVRDDPRVSDLSGISIRDVVVPGDSRPRPVVPGVHPGRSVLEVEPAPVVVTDLSFISLTLVMGRLAALTQPGGHLLALVKPQFEVGREHLGHGGVVRSPQQRHRALASVLEATGQCGLSVHGITTSPIVGGTGNREYLLWARHMPTGKMAGVDTFLDSVLRGDPA
ncbi:TlyA family RNA methyltransferase [Leekyejoonella antrihumi]|uniref:TlyA family RNA methyltransferase n=1 Tax=Leekyejoonella antrihumi TaxID=1660198 RepID=A0A563DY41_9MICO|nr:TlyA family RNA methyltransferase [Leekyejoonella antrihumi]TWP34891.1 TlyA family RNA methyltransferase [Leekyejoonella antrihumi]